MMTPTKKDAPAVPEKSTAETKPAQGSGGGGEVKSTDWRKQSEPGAPIVPGPQPGQAPTPAAKPAAKAAAPTGPAPLVAPPAGWTAGTPVTVTPYVKSGAPSYFLVAKGSYSNTVGSEDAAAQLLRNQLHLPSTPAQ